MQKQNLQCDMNAKCQKSQVLGEKAISKVVTIINKTLTFKKVSPGHKTSECYRSEYYRYRYIIM